MLELLKTLDFTALVQKIKDNPSLYIAYALAGLFLATLAIWGSREVHYRHLVRTWAVESSHLKSELNVTQDSLTKAKQEITNTRRILTQTQTLTRPDGTKLELSNSLNESWTSVYAELVTESRQREERLTQLLRDSESKRADLEVKISTPGPKYSLLAGYEILGGRDWRERTKVGAGLNIANTTIGLSVRPLAPANSGDNNLANPGWWAKFRPAVEASIRF